MQENVKEQHKSLLRKIAIIIFLPVIIVIWVTGLAITQIGDQREPAHINKKPSQTDNGFKTPQKEPKAADEDSRIVNEPIIA